MNLTLQFKGIFTLIVISAVTALIFTSQFFFEYKKKDNSTNLFRIKYNLQKIDFSPSPIISAKSALVVDEDSGTVLFEKNQNLKIAPASLTKLATALVVLEKCPPDSIITVPKKTKYVGTLMGLVEDEKITVENLLYGLLLPSGNDAADVLVLGCFESFENFLSSITKLTQRLDMINTQLKNSSGLPSKNHFSTASDLLKLTRAALANEIIAEIVSTKGKNVTDITGKISHNLTNLNKLLENPQVLGVKTGTSVLGENLIVLKVAGNHKIISVILQSQDRFSDAEKILNWVHKNFIWEPEVF